MKVVKDIHFLHKDGFERAFKQGTCSFIALVNGFGIRQSKGLHNGGEIILDEVDKQVIIERDQDTRFLQETWYRI